MNLQVCGKFMQLDVGFIREQNKRIILSLCVNEVNYCPSSLLHDHLGGVPYVMAIYWSCLGLHLGEDG